MIETVPTPQTPSYDEYGIVATFSETSLAALYTLQSQLEEVLGDAIWSTPQRALHATIMEIICDIDYGTSFRKQLFTDWRHRYNQIVAETISEMSPFEITFDQLEISKRAIIVKSADSTILNIIRSTLLSRIDLPNGTKIPPDITHCTIARYSTALNLEDVIKQANKLSVNFSERITQFKLLEDLGPPNFDPKTIEEYDLHAQ